MTVLKEYLRHQKAFEEFYAMKATGMRLDDIFQKLSLSHNRKIGTVRNWYAHFGWSQKVKEREDTIKTKLQEKASQTVEDIMVKVRPMLENMADVGYKKIMDGEVKMTISDLVAVISQLLSVYGFNPHHQKTLNTNVVNILNKIDARSLTIADKKQVLSLLEKEVSNPEQYKSSKPGPEPKNTKTE